MIAFLAAAIAAASSAAAAHTKNTSGDPKPDNFPTELREKPEKKNDPLFWCILIEALIPASLVGFAGYVLLKLALATHGIK